MAAPEPSPAKPRRRWLARGLVVLAALLAFLALHAIWLDRQLLNTDNWTASSSELLERPAVRNQAAAFLTDELYQRVDIEAAIRDALPPRAQVLAEPAARLLRERVELRARQMLQRPRVQACGLPLPGVQLVEHGDAHRPQSRPLLYI